MVAPPEEIAGYVTVRICGETAADEKERANEWCEVFSGATRRAELRLAGE